MIQFRKRANIDAADFELKMTCVDGALKYLRDRKYGLADIHLNNGKAVLPYRITAYTHNGKEVVLVDGFKDWDTAGTISRNMEDLILPLYLKNTDGEEHCRFQYVCRQEDFSQKSYEEIEAVYGSHILQKETDIGRIRESWEKPITGLSQKKGAMILNWVVCWTNWPGSLWQSITVVRT
jgi:hypothetical protein